MLSNTFTLRRSALRRCRLRAAVGLLLVLGSLGVAAGQAPRPIAMESFLADTPTPAPAVIVCPGGSYSWLDWKVEGVEVARWLQSEGISAFVLRYPVQGVLSYITHYRYLGFGHQYPDALQHLQAALTMLRLQHAEYNIDPHRLGVMGFSAGGHLAGSAAEFFTSATDRPDFVATVYPVVTMADKSCVHRRSRRALLGEYRKHQRRWQDSLSLELHTRPDMPPVFLVNCVDDPIVDYRNSVLLDSALTAAGVAHQYHQYPTGGHSFGASDDRGSAESRQWKQAFLAWVRTLTSTLK